MSQEVLDLIQSFLPPYLSADQKRDLWQELRKFPTNRGYYTKNSDLMSDYLQGDGWSNFTIINFTTREDKQAKGVILSNTCDIDTSNKRKLPSNILYSPLIKLQSYKIRLQQAGESEKSINGTIEAIQKQRISNIFYLPKLGEQLDESMILLDNIHTEPLTHFVGSNAEPIFTLNQFGFYIFIIKLSIHFTRLQENVLRTANAG